LRTSDKRRANRCASMIGIGMSWRVSRQAYPNISPWSPAPSRSTASLMSGDCESIDVITAQVSQSKP